MKRACLIGVTLFLWSSLAAETHKYSVNINGVNASVYASSEPAGKKVPSAYAQAKAFDGDKTTAWVEGVEGKGIGEWRAIGIVLCIY